MSTNLSRLVQPFVTSVIVGKDVVPRVSVVNLGRLIDQMVSSDFLLSKLTLDSLLSGARQASYQRLKPFSPQYVRRLLDELQSAGVMLSERSIALGLILGKGVVPRISVSATLGN